MINTYISGLDSKLLLNVHSKHLGPECQALGLLNDLLVGGNCLGSHDNMTLIHQKDKPFEARIYLIVYWIYKFK